MVSGKKRYVRNDKIFQTVRFSKRRITNAKLFYNHLPFAIDMFGKQMEKTVLEAKAEVDAHVTDVIMKTGIEAVRKTISIEETIK